MGLSSPDEHTLAAEFCVSGVALHSGAIARVRVMPAEVGQGRYFVRVDLPNAEAIPAQVEAVGQTLLSTELIAGGATVRTVEHLLSALVGMGVDNARIEIDAPEAPLLDGSAQDWVRAIAQVGVQAQPQPRAQWQLAEPIWIRQKDMFVAALPAPALRFTYGIDFDLPAIGNQWHSWCPTQEPFEQAIAPARTFGLADQIEYLRAQGLIKGGSLDNALVCDAQGWLNPPLRFPNEPARHKLLDLIGDLSLVGALPTAHFIAYKASHTLHTQLARALRDLQPHTARPTTPTTALGASPTIASPR
jgi:UDP-3-O-[3-hydroxymyristoyl] N-acetylglucosamine deacetylase